MKDESMSAESENSPKPAKEVSPEEAELYTILQQFDNSSIKTEVQFNRVGTDCYQDLVNQKIAQKLESVKNTNINKAQILK